MEFLKYGIILAISLLVALFAQTYDVVKNRKLFQLMTDYEFAKKELFYPFLFIWAILFFIGVLLDFFVF